MGLDTVEIILRTEETFGIDLSDSECESIATVGDLYRLVLTKLDLPYLAASEVETLGRDRAAAHLPNLCDWGTPDVWATLKGVIEDQLQVERHEIREGATFLGDLRCD